MGMQHAAVELVETGVFRHVRHAEVARGDDDIVEVLGIHPVGLQVMHRDGEVALVLVVVDHPDRGAEADPVADPCLLHPALDIVEQHGARRIAGDLLAEMLFKGIVGELQPLLRAVRPQVAVHAAMDRLAVCSSRPVRQV
jgi:hypothetical protein